MEFQTFWKTWWKLVRITPRKPKKENGTPASISGCTSTDARPSLHSFRLHRSTCIPRHACWLPGSSFAAFFPINPFQGQLPSSAVEWEASAWVSLVREILSRDEVHFFVLSQGNEWLEEKWQNVRVTLPGKQALFNTLSWNSGVAAFGLCLTFHVPTLETQWCPFSLCFVDLNRLGFEVMGRCSYLCKVDGCCEIRAIMSIPGLTEHMLTWPHFPNCPHLDFSFPISHWENAAFTSLAVHLLWAPGFKFKASLSIALWLCLPKW